MKNKFYNILYYGDFDCSTGFGMVSKNIIENWSNLLGNGGLINVFATNNYQKEAYNYKDNVYVIPAMNTRENGDTDVYARKSFLKLLYNGKYTHIFCLNDIEVINPLYEHLKKIKVEKRKNNLPSFKSILYFPIDSEVRKCDVEVLNFFDKSFTYTEYAKNSLKNLISLNTFKKLSVMPHGTNTKDFNFLDDKIKLKEKHFPNLNPDTFLFGSVNRNSARKDFGTLIYAYSEFIKENNNTALYLHCNPNDPFGINIFRLCERLNLEIDKNIFLPKDFNENKGFHISDLNELYNCFDVFITTTTAEGWGLTVTEAMATKTPIICPMHTSLKEITNNGESVMPLEILHPAIFVNDFDKIRFKSDIGEIKRTMKSSLSLDKKNLATLSYDKVVKFNWKNISKKFLETLKKI
jgi:glycosyltransferase involved in cell wall biosynthesis